MPACILTLEISSMPEDALEALIRRLPPARRERLFRLHPAQRRESAGAAALACCALQRAFSAAPAPIGLTIRQLLAEPWFVPETWPVDGRGKPFAAVSKRRMDGGMSPSPTPAASRPPQQATRPVGLDVQRLPAAFTTQQLERFCRRLHPEEAAALHILSGERQREAFCRLWTGKESVLKLTGLGLRGPLNRFAVPLEKSPAQIAFLGSRIQIHWYTLPQGSLALSRYEENPACFRRQTIPAFGNRCQKIVRIPHEKKAAGRRLYG